jgi:hypothetical protein
MDHHVQHKLGSSSQKGQQLLLLLSNVVRAAGIETLWHC